MLKEIMHYTQVADGKLIEIFQKEQDISPKVISLFSHVLNAQHVWANRILGLQAKLGVWENIEVEHFSEISKQNFKLLGEIFDTMSMDKEITYKNSTGEYTNTVKDILFHAFNHSTYHRAQIAAMLKLDGIHPPVTDYIMLKRDQQL
ncbi:DinB family protein [Pedobacter fastidiosus]|uniref:Damage-inducible protein DinB n=1 Tax=Pedobacter fastidiosus TaxID=2765361 RepID=A0ABR7KXA2_9SPHI|nr:DinB family protein [Pedobacter fastidiosus]MBC6112539.1 damage-inducible protein DinB [Pedobacter fastidiosus]